MAFMQQLACNRLTEAELILVAPNASIRRTASSRLVCSGLRCRLGGRQRVLFNDGLKVLLQSHPSGLRLGEKARFDFRPECKRDRHKSIRRFF